MTKVVLALAAFVDLGLAALLIGISGFIFGAHEGMNGEPWAVAAWTAALIVCLAAPIAGFILNSRKQSGAGLIVAWLPPAGALLAMAIPPPY